MTRASTVRMLVGLLAIAALACCGQREPANDVESDTTAIEAALRQWPNDFNAENVPAVCSLFADDVVLAYPGGEDRNRDEFCTRMQVLFDDPNKQYGYGQPDIREVLVAGDLATVKLFWTLTVKDASGTVIDTSVEDGLDVFVRQPDGSWKIHVSHAFTRE